jgi:hypothetical protein
MEKKGDCRGEKNCRLSWVGNGMNTNACQTCLRLAAEAEFLARLDWWAWWEKARELEEHERTHDENN